YAAFWKQEAAHCSVIPCKAEPQNQAQTALLQPATSPAWLHNNPTYSWRRRTCDVMPTWLNTMEIRWINSREADHQLVAVLQGHASIRTWDRGWQMKGQE
ncbi:mCG144588, partial [Mus musculus]